MERDGEGWRGMERDRQGWTGMDRDGERGGEGGRDGGKGCSRRKLYGHARSQSNHTQMERDLRVRSQKEIPGHHQARTTHLAREGTRGRDEGAHGAPRDGRVRVGVSTTSKGSSESGVIGARSWGSLGAYSECIERGIQILHGAMGRRGRASSHQAHDGAAKGGGGGRRHMDHAAKQ